VNKAQNPSTRKKTSDQGEKWNVNAEWVCGIDHKYKGHIMGNIFI
jgi:hypothetical protein